MCLIFPGRERTGMTVGGDGILKCKRQVEQNGFLYRGPAWMMDNAKRVWYKRVWFSVART